MLEHETHLERVSIDILECIIKLKIKGFVHGPVTSGFLTLKGRLIPASRFPNQESSLAMEDSQRDDPNLMAFSDDDDSDGYIDDVEMTDVPDSSSSIESQETTSSCVDAAMLDGVELIADAIESEWVTDDRNLAVEVRCLQILAQKDAEGCAGLILVLSAPGASTYRRVGHFFFDVRQSDLFAEIHDQTITII